MHNKTKYVKNKAVTLDNFKKVADIIDDRFNLLVNPNSFPRSIEGKFTEHSVFETDDVRAFDHRIYETEKLTGLTLKRGRYHKDFYCYVDFNNTKIEITVGGPDLDWVNSSVNEILSYLESIKAQTYNGSFLFKYYPIRIIINSAVCFFLYKLILFGFNNLLPKFYKDNEIFIDIVAVLIQLGVFFGILENKSPVFSKIWPSVEFLTGPIDKREEKLRNEAMGQLRRTAFVLTVVLIPWALVFFVPKF